MTDSSESSENSLILQGGFFLIATMLRKLEFDIPAQITNTIRLEAATQEQIDIFKYDVLYPHLYEKEVVVTNKTSSSKSYSYIDIPINEWRYYVFSYSGDGYEIHNFMDVANLVPPYPISFIDYMTDEPFGHGKKRGWSIDTAGQQDYYNAYVMPNIDSYNLTSENLEEMKELFGRFQLLDKKIHEGILRAIRLNRSVQRLKAGSIFSILGLFMLIEMLLAHNPNNKEIGDSLTHQLKTKMAFVSARFKRALDYSRFDATTSPDQIWGALYHYRSCIAHGNHIDFSDGTLRKLKSADDAFEFLNAATKELLAYAISQPDIVNGLKPI